MAKKTRSDVDIAVELARYFDTDQLQELFSRLTKERYISIHWYTYNDVYQMSGMTEYFPMSLHQRAEVLRFVDETIASALQGAFGGIARTAIEEIWGERSANRSIDPGSSTPPPGV